METITPDRLSTLFRQFPLGLALLETSGEVVFVNDTLAAMTSLEAFELMGQGFYDELFPASELNQRIREKTLSAVEAPFDDLDLTCDTPRLGKRTLHISGGRVREGEALFIVLVVQDVTSKKAFEKVIESSFDNFIQVTNALDSAMKKINEQNAILEEYKQKMTRELNIAKSVQKAIIPKEFPVREGFSMYGLSIPSEELGGDYFDYFELDEDHIGLLIADVSGHGVPSSLITTMVKAYFEYYTKHYRDAGLVLQNVNRDMAEIITDTGFYLTAFYAVLNLKTRAISVSVAGHDAALCFSPALDQVLRLGDGCEGTILGVFPDAVYSTQSYQLEADSKILLFTDGISEARSDGGEFYGAERLEQFLRRQAHKTSRETVDDLVTEIDQFYGTNQPNDDRTLVVFDLFSDTSRLAAAVPASQSAKKAFLAKDFGRAVAEFERSFAQGDRSAEGLYLAGQSALFLKREQQAITWLRESVALDPSAYKSWYYLGLALYNRQDLSGARQAWIQVQKLNPGYKDTAELLVKLSQSSF